MREPWEHEWKDYYGLLGLDPSAEPEVVAGAYRALARKYHPDKSPDPHGRKMKLLNEAYEVLSDPQRRSWYDRKYRRREGQEATDAEGQEARAEQATREEADRERAAEEARRREEAEREGEPERRRKEEAERGQAEQGRRRVAEEARRREAAEPVTPLEPVDAIAPVDLTPLTLSYEGHDGSAVTIFKRNTAIPAEKVLPFSVSGNGQDQITIKLFQGEEATAAGNPKLCELIVHGIRPAPSRVASVQVTFRIDSDGILSASAAQQPSGRPLGVTYSHCHGLSRNEVEDILRRG